MDISGEAEAATGMWAIVGLNMGRLAHEFGRRNVEPSGIDVFLRPTQGKGLQSDDFTRATILPA